MPATEYGRRRRSYEGGSPLPRLLDRPARLRWGRLLESILPPSPRGENSMASRLAPLANAMVKIERELGSHVRDTRTIINDTRSVLDGRKGVLPEKAFMLGEALYEAGVKWSSGLLTLALASSYFPHAVALMGAVIREVNESDPSDDFSIRGMRNGFQLASTLHDDVMAKQRVSARNERVELLDRLRHGAVCLTWDASQHLLLRHAWRIWLASKESTAGMPESIRHYTSLSRTLSASSAGQRQNALILVRSFLRHGVDNIFRLEGTVKAKGLLYALDDGNAALHANIELPPLEFDILFVGAAAKTLDSLDYGSRIKITGYLTGGKDGIQIVADLLEA